METCGRVLLPRTSAKINPCPLSRAWRVPQPHPRCRPSAALPNSRTITTRNLPTTVVDAFYVVQDPPLFSHTYSSALLSFVDSAVLAYECGMNEDCLHKELLVYKGMQEATSAPPDMRLNMAACMFATALVWVTLLKAPQTRIRWATLNPVTDETLRMWGGFVGLIVDGYFNQGMRWYPLDRLELEVQAVHGKTYSQNDIAEWSRIVFTTLEQVFPADNCRRPEF